jgi:hypothetical protein
MTRKEKAGFGKGKAGPSGEAINPRIIEAIQSRASASGLACAAAFAMAADIGVTPKAVGEAMDQLQVPIIKCQLGLFGYSPKKRIVKAAQTVTADDEKSVRQAIVNGKLPCATCWQLAVAFGKTRLELAAICEKLVVKIGPCQLGAF